MAQPCEIVHPPAQRAGSQRTGSPPRELVLCFDGTGNTVRSEPAQSNILKIFRMVDRDKPNRSGIGTGNDTSSFGSLANTLSNLPAHKIYEQGFAKSFAQHVIGGYRFLARRWESGARIYLFGFSRGAYTARFLNELLDFVGLISTDNEELIPYVWEAFTEWKFSPPGKERDAAWSFLDFIRDTCRSIGYVHFLGLFDTVNSVTKFNLKYDGEENDDAIQPNPRILRHAVSIDERRIKFQPVLFAKMRESGARPGRVSTWAAHGDETYTGHPYHDGSEKDTDSDSRALPPMLNQDFEEVYFAGDHSDVGGGWPAVEGNKYTASQIPLMWMVHEAELAGLTFVPAKLRRWGCFHADGKFDQAVIEAASRAPLHDSLQYESGKIIDTFLWRVMECLPYKRPKIAPDGTVGMSRLHGWGLRRLLPPGAKVHKCVLDRLKSDLHYKPYNLGQGKKPKETDENADERHIGEWRFVGGKGFRDYWARIERMPTNEPVSGAIEEPAQSMPPASE